MHVTFDGPVLILLIRQHLWGGRHVVYRDKDVSTGSLPSPPKTPRPVLDPNYDLSFLSTDRLFSPKSNRIMFY